jgi:hypothetical protein
MPSFWVSRPRVLFAASADEEVRVILVHAVRRNTVRNASKRKLVDTLPVKSSTSNREILLRDKGVTSVAKNIHRYQSRLVAEVPAQESL